MATEPGRRHVLAIDGDPAVLDLFRQPLEGEGFRVSTRSDAGTDPEEIKGLAPDLILVDCLQPGKGVGWSLLRTLRRNHDTARIPVVLCTAAAREVEAHAGHLAELGVTAVLKPFDVDQLLREIAARLAARAREEAGSRVTG